MGFLVKTEKLETTAKAGPDKKSSFPRPPPISNNRSTEVITLQKSKSQDGQPKSESLKDKIRAARKRGMKGDVQDLRYLVEEGPLSFRSFGFIGGFFMILAAALDLIEDAADGTFEPIAKFITFYLWLCGLTIVQLEGRPFHFQIPVVYETICAFFNFLRYVWGRGFFYFFTGCVQFFMFTKYNMICGGYFVALGVFSIVFGYRASVKLASLRNAISCQADIKFLFHSFDKDRDGYLDHEEFREMIMSLDQSLDYNDFVAAMSAVDSDNNQRVTYNDLESWWESYTKTDLPPGTKIYRSISMGKNPSKANGMDAYMMA